MNVGELLSELRVNVLNDRSDRTSGSSDYLWTDATLVRYIDEAQRRLARKGLVIRDGSTPEVVNVTIATGVKDYALHPSVIAVMSARYQDDSFDLKRTNHSLLSAYRIPDNQIFDVNTAYSLPDGKPLGYSTDEEVGNDEYGSAALVTMRLFPTPSSDYNNKLVKLRVVRMPVNRLSFERLGEFPEVPEEHHIDMLDWAAYLALRIVDHDQGDSPRADEFRASFENLVKEARSNAMRKMFAPTGWGFGRGGYAWES